MDKVVYRMLKIHEKGNAQVKKQVEQTLPHFQASLRDVSRD